MFFPVFLIKLIIIVYKSFTSVAILRNMKKL